MLKFEKADKQKVTELMSSVPFIWKMMFSGLETWRTVIGWHWIVGMRRNRLLYGGISDKGNGKEAGCNGRTESNRYDEMDRIDE